MPRAPRNRVLGRLPSGDLRRRRSSRWTWSASAIRSRPVVLVPRPARREPEGPSRPASASAPRRVRAARSGAVGPPGPRGPTGRLRGPDRHGRRQRHPGLLLRRRAPLRPRPGRGAALRDVRSGRRARGRRRRVHAPVDYGRRRAVRRPRRSARVVPVIGASGGDGDGPCRSTPGRRRSRARPSTAGADLVNDVSALGGSIRPNGFGGRGDGAGVLLMHMRGHRPAHDAGRHRPTAHPLATSRRSSAAAASGPSTRASRPTRSPSIPASVSGRARRATSCCSATSRRCASLGFARRRRGLAQGLRRRFSGVGDDAPPADRLPGSLAALAAARGRGRGDRPRPRRGRDPSGSCGCRTRSPARLCRRGAWSRGSQ